MTPPPNPNLFLKIDALNLAPPIFCQYRFYVQLSKVGTASYLFRRAPSERKTNWIYADAMSNKHHLFVYFVGGAAEFYLLFIFCYAW